MQHTRSPAWPKGVPTSTYSPNCSLSHFLETSALRYPDKPAVIYCGSTISYAELHLRVETMASHLVQKMGVKPGDRVLLLSQNCPQFTVAFYAILRARAMVVPINAMTTSSELAYYITDSGARHAFIAQEHIESITPYLNSEQSPRLDAVIVHAYSSELPPQTPENQTPDWVMAPTTTLNHPKLHAFTDLINIPASPLKEQPTADDLCVLPYTSGTTGHPKGCIHTHRTVAASVASSCQWRGVHSESVILSVAPLFHMLGMQAALNQPIALGATVIMMPRWNREVAAHLIQQYKVSIWSAPPAMVIDFFSQPNIQDYDLDSLALLSGGGAAMPESVARLLDERYQIKFNEAYGLSETASFLHANPINRPKKRCLGLATSNVDSRIIDPETLQLLPQGEVGELITHAPQVMLGYWNNDTANQEAFIEIDGKRFLRTGDLASIDEEGYFFMHERLKRMINASGYKVWPAEVENTLYEHPAIHEACIIGIPDNKRGETVKAVICLKPEFKGTLTAEDLIAWCRQRMAVYKAPHYVAFVDELEKSNTGKILWRAIEAQHRTLHQS